MMIVICEECGKKYTVDPVKIKEGGVKARCEACGNVQRVSRPEDEGTVKKPAVEPSSFETQPEPLSPPEKTAEPAYATEQQEAPSSSSGYDSSRKRGMGLRTKIFLLFFLLPISLMIAAGVLYIQQLNALSTLITGEGTRIVENLGEQIIQDKARAVAKQVSLFLDQHPGREPHELAAMDEFQEIAVQEVGLTGYTALHAEPDEDGIWRNWGHANPDIVGIDMSTLSGPMGDNFDGFWEIFTGGRDGRESSGYYTWQERDGSFRDKYMVCTPVEGSDFYVAATTYLDEFTQPVEDLEERAHVISTNTQNTVFAILGGTLLLIGLVVALYGRAITRRIRYMTDIAEQISVGEMDTEIQVQSNDELGELAEAIGRMQESIRISIERLRRRR